MGDVKVSGPSKIKDEFRHFAARPILISVLVGVAYYLAARAGFIALFHPHPISVMWMPNSILLAALLLTPVRGWFLPLLAVFCAHMIIELKHGVPLNMASCWFISNASEAVIGAALTRTFIKGPVRFDTLRNLEIFFICGAFASAFLSSFLDAAFVVLNHWGTDSYWQMWHMRFFSNGFACAMLVPAIVSWSTVRPVVPPKFPAARLIEAFLLTVSLSLVSLAVFYYSNAEVNVIPAILYAPLPFLLWAAVRFDIRAITTAIFGVAVLAIWSAVDGHGPFLTSSPEQNALSIQIFFVILSAMLLPLATTLAERQTVSDAFLNSQERYREVVESQTDLVCRYLADTTLTFVNEAYCQFFKRTREDLIGRKFLELLPPKAHETVLLGIASLMVYRRSITTEHEVLLPEGSIGWQQWVDRVIIDSDGHTREVQGIGRDITARVRVETALRESEERNRAILNAIPDLIFLLNKSGVYIDFHARDERRLLVPPQQLLGRTVREVLPIPVAEDVLRCIDYVLRTGEMKLLEYTVSVSGEDRTFEARMVWGGSEKVWSLVRDITEQKRAEETRQNLTHALRLAVVGELTAMIAHEVNQPLNAILNNSEAAEGLLNSNEPPINEFRNILADIRNDVLRASEAIRRVRALSQKRAIAMQRLYVPELINDVIRLVTADATRRRVQIQSRLATNLPPVLGDPVHLQQVLLNLIINGMDAMEHLPDGQRTLTVRAERDQDDHLVVAVRDTGHGIPPDVLPRIFKSFYSTKKDGMGVGLSIARSIIEAHGGRIWCENNVSGGATFRFALPLDNAPQNLR